MASHRLLMISTHGYVAGRPQLGQPDTGGQVVYVLELSKALAALGFEIDILTRQFEDQPSREIVGAGVRIVRIPYGGSAFRPKEVLAQFTSELVDRFARDAEIKRLDYSLISSHYWDAGIAGLALSRYLGIPHVHTPHSMGVLKRQNCAWGGNGETPSDHLDERIQQERIIYHRADLLIPTAAEQTRSLVESDEYNVPAEKIAQIPPGFDETLFYRTSDARRISIRQTLGWNQPTIFAAGRIAQSKGYDLILQAFPAVLRRVPDARLVLAIGGKRRSAEEQQVVEELQALAAQLDVADQFTITPCVEQRRLADYYRAADIFVLSSRNEPFGMTAIEAIASGTPTVVTTHGGLWEELTWGQDAIYCDPLDPDALAQAICSPLMQPRIRQQMSAHGAATAASRYTWSVVAGQMADSWIEKQWIQVSHKYELAQN